MEMDSPDRNLNTPSSAVQGSPFFNYLCNLSPIKPVKSVHVAQTFSELNFPPPPAVFTSPRVPSQKESNFLKRPCQKDTRDEENKSVNTSCEKVKDFAVTMSDSLASDQTKCEDNNMSTFASCSPSKLLEEYLADPVEEENYTVKPQESVTNQCSKMKDMEMIPQSNFPEEFLGVDKIATEAETSQGDEGGTFSLNSEGSMKVSDVRKMGDTDQNDTEGLSSVWSDVDGHHSNALLFANSCESSETGASHDENLVDQTAAAFAFILSKDSTCDIEGWQKASSADCSGAFLQQGSNDTGNHADRAGRQNDLDSTPQLLHDSFLDTKSSGDPNTKLDTEQNRVVEHQTSFGCKPGNQSQRGIRRRCLDFEASEAQRKTMSNSCWKSTSLMPKTSALVNSTNDSETKTSPSVSCEEGVTSDCKQIVPLKREAGVEIGRNSQSSSNVRLSNFPSKSTELTSDKCDSNVRNNGNTPITVGIPSGIGLHLNSLATTMPLNCGGNMLTSAKGSVSMQGMLPSSVVKEASSDVLGSSLPSVNSGGNISVGSNSNIASGMVVSMVEKTRIDQQELQSSGTTQIGVTRSTTCFRSVTVGIKPLQSRLPFKSEERNLSPLGKKRPALLDISQQSPFGTGEEFSQSSPKKKRRKSTTIGDKEGCKRCNCKKSKCLKLYCECFAAGVYCVEPCTCQECFNKPEYQDMVLGTRQQIESRNPLAFAPKIVRGAESPPTNGDECGETPSSARHKRGCNCKKSMCLKKYCECYQAGVGCSDGCRCEGCKNVYGKKEGGSDEIEDNEASIEGWDKDCLEEKAEVQDVGNDILLSEQQHAKDLSPLTPSFQYSCQGKSSGKLNSCGKKCFTSEDLESPTVSQSCAKPPRSPGKILRPTKGLQGNITAIHNRQAGSRTSASPIFTPKMDKSGQFSPQWDCLADICTLTPMLHPPMRPSASSASNVDGIDVSPFSGQQNEISCMSSRPLASRHSYHIGSSGGFRQPAARSPVCTADNIHWQTPVNAKVTPVTPALSTTACTAGNKLADGSDFDMNPHDVSGSLEDDTPDILKNNCSPTRGLKASSPNQKRVSPPHNYCPKELMNRRPISSPGIKSGRKYILQSVPSFPPLTPLSGEGQANE